MYYQHNLETEMESLENWLSVEEIAVYLGVSKESIYRWLDRKTIPAHRLGKLWKFKPSEVDQWLTSGSAAETNSQHQQGQI